MIQLVAWLQMRNYLCCHLANENKSNESHSRRSVWFLWIRIRHYL